MKQVIIVRSDLKMPKGKMCAQVAHASVSAVLKSDKKVVKEWCSSGMAKIVVKVGSLRELRKYNQLAKDAGIVTAVITDAGRTVVASGTTTCCAVGPYKEKVVDAVTSSLKLV
jgi:PTH2 family peptidyl-tRNA hydrolase